MKAICIGHSTYDITLPVEDFPIENKKTRIKDNVECGGGPASNAAYLLSKWGVDTIIGSALGDDYYADKIIGEFKKVGADTRYLEKHNEHFTSSSYIIANQKTGSRTVITSKDEPIKQLNKKIIEKADIVLVDGEHPLTALETLENNPNAISILDAGRLNDYTKQIGKKVTYLICSKDFAKEFSKINIDTNNINDLKDCYHKLNDYFNTNIIITLEESGSFTKILDEYKIISTIKVKSIDTTGAGDIYHGAFAYFIGNNYKIEDTIKYASITAALSTTKLGSRIAIPELKEVLEYDTII